MESMGYRVFWVLGPMEVGSPAYLWESFQCFVSVCPALICQSWLGESRPRDQAASTSTHWRIRQSGDWVWFPTPWNGSKKTGVLWTLAHHCCQSLVCLSFLGVPHKQMISPYYRMTSWSCYRQPQRSRSHNTREVHSIMSYERVQTQGVQQKSCYPQTGQGRYLFLFLVTPGTP